MITEPSEFRQLLLDIQNSVDVIYTTLPSDEPRFIIDANSRTINIPIEFQFLGVKNDHNAETVYFEIDRYFDAEDLSQHTCVIQFSDKNNSNDGGIYPVTTMDTTSVDGKIIFGWEIKNDATSIVGDIYFSVRFYSIDNTDYTFTYNFNTLTAKSSILDTIDVKEYPYQSPTPEQFQVYIDMTNDAQSLIKTLETNFTEAEQKNAISREKLLTVIDDINIINGTGEGSIKKAIADVIAQIIAEAPESFDNFKEISDWITSHSSDAAEMNGRILQNTNELYNKVDKNQGFENSKKIMAVDESGYVRPTNPIGIKYDEEKQMLRFGVFSINTSKYNLPIVLDCSSDTITFDYSKSDTAVVTLNRENKPLEIINANVNGSIAVVTCYGGMLDFSDTTKYNCSATFGYLEPLENQHMVYSMMFNGSKWDVSAMVYAGGVADA